MSSDRKGPTVKPSGSETDGQQATETEIVVGTPRQEGPTEETSSDDRYNGERHKSSGRRRTDLRTTDEHASWREVAYSCHCEPGR